MDLIARSDRQLGAALRRFRKKAGLTQRALGERACLRQATVSHVETGEPAVQLQTVMAMLSALDLELVVRPRSKSDPADLAELF